MKPFSTEYKRVTGHSDSVCSRDALCIAYAQRIKNRYCRPTCVTANAQTDNPPRRRWRVSDANSYYATSVIIVNKLLIKMWSFIDAQVGCRPVQHVTSCWVPDRHHCFQDSSSQLHQLSVQSDEHCVHDVLIQKALSILDRTNNFDFSIAISFVLYSLDRVKLHHKNLYAVFCNLFFRYPLVKSTNL